MKSLARRKTAARSIAKELRRSEGANPAQNFWAGDNRRWACGEILKYGYHPAEVFRNLLLPSFRSDLQ